MNRLIIILNSLRIFIILGMSVLILFGIRVASDIISLFVLAFFVSVLLNPLVKQLVKLYFPRMLAIVLLLSIIFIAMVLLVAYLGSELNEIICTLPRYRSSLIMPLFYFQSWLKCAGIFLSEKELIKYIDPNDATILITGLLTQSFSAISSTFLLFLTIVFMLLEVPNLSIKIQKLIIQPKEKIETVRYVIENIFHYLFLKTIISLIIGIIIWSILSALSVQFSFIWGLLAFFLNYIPNVGSTLSAIPPIIQLLIFNNFYKALLVLLGYLIINLVFGNLLESYIMVQKLKLSALVIFLSLIFWGWLLGPVGIFFCVPLTIIIKIFFEKNKKRRHIAIFLGNINKMKK